MALSKKQKQYIRKNCETYTPQHMTKKLDVTEQEVRDYIKKIDHYKKKVEGKKEFIIDSLNNLKTFLRANIPFIILLTGLCIGLYANSLQAEFVSDDIAEYVQSEIIKNPRAVFLNYKNLRIQTVIYAINYQLFRINPTPLHLIALLTHVINTILVFTLAYMFLGKKVAIITSLLFAAHPVNTEAIVWISAINYLWGATIVFLILLFHTLHINSKKYSYVIATAVLFTLAAFLLKSPWLMVVPFILITVDQLILRERVDIKAFFKYMLPLGIGCLIFFATTVLSLILPRVTFVEGLNKYSPQDKLPYIIHGPYTVLMAMKLLVYPKDLTFYHEGEPLGEHFFLISKIASVFVILLILVLWKKQRKLAGLTLAIFVAILPSLSPIQIAWYIAERYLYAPAAFFSMLIALLLIKAEETLKIKKLAITCTTLILILYSIKTVVRNSEWRTPKKLWLATARVADGSPRVYNNLGDIFSQEGDYERAIKAFQMSVNINPKYAEARYNLGRTYLMLNELDLAEQKFREAIEIKPELYQGYYILGITLGQKGDIEQARMYLLKALEINPNYTEAQVALDTLNNSL